MTKKEQQAILLSMKGQIAQLANDMATKMLDKQGTQEQSVREIVIMLASQRAKDYCKQLADDINQDILNFTYVRNNS